MRSFREWGAARRALRLDKDEGYKEELLIWSSWLDTIHHHTIQQSHVLNNSFMIIAYGARSESLASLLGLFAWKRGLILATVPIGTCQALHPERRIPLWIRPSLLIFGLCTTLPWGWFSSPGTNRLVSPTLSLRDAHSSVLHFRSTRAPMLQIFQRHIKPKKSLRWRATVLHTKPTFHGLV